MVARNNQAVTAVSYKATFHSTDDLKLICSNEFSKNFAHDRPGTTSQ